MDVKIIDIILCNARNFLPLNIEVDLVMLDPPCSGIGSFWRMPSSKWMVDFKTVENLANIQWEMLNACHNYVKKGDNKYIQHLV